MTNSEPDIAGTSTNHTVANMFAADQASQQLGISIDDSGEGFATVSMTVTNDMLNGLGIGHGGLVFALADSAMAFATNAGGRPAVAIQAEIDWLRPARLGARLTASAIQRHKRGRSAITDVTVTDDQGEVIAEFRGRTRIVDQVPTTNS